MSEKITTCQLCRKYMDCESAYSDPVFDEHGFDFPCFVQDYFTPEQLKARSGNFCKQPQMKCPKCGAVYDDFDGVGVLHCPACGYCVHPATETVDGKTTCCVCGRETTKKEKRNNEEN